MTTRSPAYEAGRKAGLADEPNVNPYSKYGQFEPWADWGAGWLNGKRPLTTAPKKRIMEPVQECAEV